MSKSCEARRPRARTILEGLCISISEGESVAIAGPSGCGRSTVLNLICGFVTPNLGRISIGGLACSFPRQQHDE
ncbi:ATP-binding cassette domain-containing protein [Rhizobium rhizogenes]|uniref:ATP-binding cassette domain-containing protein n=1 Tax=Rhizobium rhizogenes TaxID=359 RepID=UPI001571E469|nr:ATP-binding cassette domain-containing protein [Rhizobium rhizogenes]NTH33454.1 ATP-binding cassette domain-containing protein [Rhizobium rhizogenes]